MTYINASTFIEKYSEKKYVRMYSCSLFSYDEILTKRREVHSASAPFSSLSSPSRMRHAHHQRFLPTNCLTLRFRATLCFRRNGVSGAHSSQQPLASFLRAKFRQVLPLRALQRTSTCSALAVETYCTVCTSV